jgi:hypothetical protein
LCRLNEGWFVHKMLFYPLMKIYLQDTTEVPSFIHQGQFDFTRWAVLTFL